MTRLNLMLFCALILVCLGVVTAQHKARKLYSAHEQLQVAAAKYKTEYEQLRLEQSTWAMHSRVEEIAARQLKMEVPDAKRIQVIVLDELNK
ncbi:MAG: cell division protein FtsL [Methylophilaceae bacterium]|nr:MAG: cell division protein FtsL [Methylophilaceae bacterium]